MSTAVNHPERPFRFFDNREKYLLFVTTCGEKWAIAERVGLELPYIEPHPPALRLFDAGTGDGTVLTSVLRHMHEEFPTVPYLIVGKEISVEDVRMTLEKMSDRFSEHPQMVMVMTNMHYAEAPVLWPSTAQKAERINWCEVALEGETAHEFDAQIATLQPKINDWWQVSVSEKTGNPLYRNPSVLVLYRADQRFRLDSVIPQKAPLPRTYDLVISAQPYRLRQSAERKVRMVLEPLAKALRPGGRLITIQGTGQDPGMEIIRRVWPDQDPFHTPGPMLAETLRSRLRASMPDLDFWSSNDKHALFRYSLYVTPKEMRGHISTSTLLAAWNAAVYVAQINDTQVAEAMSHSRYLDATREVLSRYGGLWFINESFVVSRKR